MDFIESEKYFHETTTSGGGGWDGWVWVRDGNLGWGVREWGTGHLLERVSMLGEFESRCPGFRHAKRKNATICDHL